MGIFSKPKCPHCGGVLTPTHYAFPFPQLRCNNCIRVNKGKQDLEKRIQALKQQLQSIKNNQL